MHTQPIQNTRRDEVKDAQSYLFCEIAFLLGEVFASRQTELGVVLEVTTRLERMYRKLQGKPVESEPKPYRTPPHPVMVSLLEVAESQRKKGAIRHD